MKKIELWLLFCCSTRCIFSAIGPQDPLTLHEENEQLRLRKIDISWSRTAYRKLGTAITPVGAEVLCKPIYDKLAQSVEEEAIKIKGTLAKEKEFQLKQLKEKLFIEMVLEANTIIHDLWNDKFMHELKQINLKEYYDLIKNCIKDCSEPIFELKSCEKAFIRISFKSLISQSIHDIVAVSKPLLNERQQEVEKEKAFQERAEKEKERQSIIKKLCIVRATKESQLQSSLNRTLNEFDLFAQEDCNLIINDMKRLKEMAAKIVVIKGLIKDLLIDQDHQRELMMIDQGHQRESMMVDQDHQRILSGVRASNAMIALIRKKTLKQTCERQLESEIENLLAESSGVYHRLKLQQSSERLVVVQNIIDRQLRERAGFVYCKNLENGTYVFQENRRN